MVIKTYYWHNRVVGKLLPLLPIVGKNKTHYFKHGNAGDIFVSELLKRLYGAEGLNTDASPRLLCIGSIAHKAKNGDLLCGIGVKDRELIKHRDELGEINITGLRGPLTEQILKSKGYDTSGVKFLLDPGLYIRYFFSETEISPAAQGKIIFIPHYRERDFYQREKLPSEVKLINIDAQPLKLAQKILKARLVFSSSLHGIIFAHALNRPAIFIQPKTMEPLLKYEDYYLSLNRDMPRPLEKVNLKVAASMYDSEYTPSFEKRDFSFPTSEELISRNIMG